MVTVFPSYTIAGFTAAVLVLIPLPRQIRVRNIATIAITFWLFQHCFAASVNTVVWRGNVNDLAPVWCDTTCALRDGVRIALPACTLCICKHLEFISSRRAIMAESVKRRRIIFELAMCIALPTLWIFLGYCFRAHRYILVEDFGCYSDAVISNAYLIFFIAPTLALSVITLVYGTIAIFHLFSYHKASIKLLTPHLKSRGDALSGAQYYRYMIMSMVLGLWGVVWISIEISELVAGGISPLPSWGVIHAYGHVASKLTKAMMTAQELDAYFVFWWAVPGGAFFYFVLFGTSPDGLTEYPKMWSWVKTKVLRLPPELTPFTMPRFPTHFNNNTIVLDDLESRGETFHLLNRSKPIRI